MKDDMNNSVDDFLAVCSPAVRDLALQLRTTIRRSMPGALEQVDLPSNMIGYGFDRTYTGLICSITPYKAHVSLMFAHGAKLPDPSHLLEGAGKGVRHVQIRTPADIENPAVQALLAAAAAVAK